MQPRCWGQVKGPAMGRNTSCDEKQFPQRPTAHCFAVQLARRPGPVQPSPLLCMLARGHQPQGLADLDECGCTRGGQTPHIGPRSGLSDGPKREWSPRPTPTTKPHISARERGSGKLTAFYGRFTAYVARQARRGPVNNLQEHLHNR